MLDILKGADMDNLDIIGILKLGLPGLVFLLSVLSYWLLANEQKKSSPSNSVLKAIKQFMYINIVLALLTVAAPFVENRYFPKSRVFDIQAKSDPQLQAGIAAVCVDADYANRYLLVKDTVKVREKENKRRWGVDGNKNVLDKSAAC